MFFVVITLTIASSAFGQGYHGDPRSAAIINEQRFLSATGSFGAAYQQEDGINYKEESDADGTRRGSYSYVDPNGQTRTVTFTAGKNGFQASGDGIPQPLPTVLPQAPRPQYTPLPQYNSPDYQSQPQYQPEPQPQYQPQAQYQPQQQYQSQPQSQYRPQPQPQYRPQPQPQPQYRPQPQYNHPPQQYSTTPAPHRFYPPGKLSLNRSPDGFSYTFKQS